jgi:putative membrane protein
MNMHWLRMSLMVLALIAFAGVAVAEEGQQASAQQSGADANTSGAQAKVSATAQKFVKEAAQGSMAEVELGNLAKDKASKDEVKQFAERMVQDHSKANEELKSIAQQKNIALPTDLPAKEKAHKEKLASLSGDEFDREYMRQMLKDHRKDVNEFKRASKNVKDEDIQNFAQKTLPTLQDHLKQAQQVAKSVGVTSASQASAGHAHSTATGDQNKSETPK